jgi:hypothetical protein
MIPFHLNPYHPTPHNHPYLSLPTKVGTKISNPTAMGPAVSVASGHVSQKFPIKYLTTHSTGKTIAQVLDSLIVPL